MENIAKILPSIGALDEEITIQAATETRDSYGGKVETWANEETVFARVEYPSTGSKEKDSADQETSFLRVNFTVRYRGNLSAKKRVIYGTQICDILYIRPLGRQRYEVINCEMREESTV
jgi:SPP1 family predicted phage head-tail adaptor